MLFQGQNYLLNITVNTNGAYVENGGFYGIALKRAPLFEMKIQTRDDRCETFTSETGWRCVTASGEKKKTVLSFVSPRGIDGLVITLVVRATDTDVTFQTIVENASSVSVISITYPTPRLYAEEYTLFLPLKAGKELQHAEQIHRQETYHYPQHTCMQFYAAYSRGGGIYLGIEDGTASAKQFVHNIEGKDCCICAILHAPGASTPANSFVAPGVSRWGALTGDWYDAALQYRVFTERDASWLPRRGKNGREDTSAAFRNIGLWISDYIPNTTEQGDNRPMNLSAGSDIYEPDYWYRAPIELRERLGVPIAYHVYNWHRIPFNIEYPHFLPAKEEFLKHAEELRRADIRVLPYINACAWEMHDDEGGHAETFADHGKHGAAVDSNGTFIVEHYPQSTKAGHKSDLAIMCGGYTPWHAYMAALAREMQETLPIDGIYFDQIANVPAHPCYSGSHGHQPGGGSYWTDGYNQMMQNIRETKPKEHFYFTECNAEPYMKHIDGFLTWMWVDADEVPAFSAVYHGYVQLIGRCTIGNKKDDIDFFKYATARSLVSGQMLGWCKADIVWSEKHMPYLMRMVKCRYENAAFLSGAVMLRPPRISTPADMYTTRAGLWFTDTIHCEWVLGGAFRSYDEREVRVFLVNFSDETICAEIAFSPAEYGITAEECMQVTIPGEDVVVLTFPAK